MKPILPAAAYRAAAYWCRGSGRPGAQAVSEVVPAGFGSLIIDDPKGVSEKILAAARHVQPAGQRILLSRYPQQPLC